MHRPFLACLIAATGFARAEVIDIRLQSEWEETGIIANSKAAKTC